MSVRSYNPRPDDDHIACDTDILEDWPQRIARETLIPRIAKKTRNALNTVPVYVEQFQRLRQGRRCSCFYIETDASAVCVVCYGTGIVGGFQKRGCKVDVLDTTSPYMKCVNVEPNYGAMSRPVYMSLLDTALKGSIEIPWTPTKNVGIMDLSRIYDNLSSRPGITYSIRLNTEVNYVPLTDAALTQRIALAQPMWFRADLHRPTLTSPIPKFIAFRMSYRISRLSALRADVPRTLKSRTLEEFGFTDTWTPQQFSFGNDMKTLDNDDFFVLLTDNSRWKVTEWQDNRILSINTSWDCTCRLIQDYNVTYMRVPLGNLDVPESQMPPHEVRSMQTETDIFVSKGITHERLPGGRADIDRAHDLAVGVEPGGLMASKPIAER